MEDSGIYNQNKGYAKQETKDLMNDNPIAKDASGGRGGSWMSKHSQSKMGGGSPAKMYEDSPAAKMNEMYNGQPGVQKEDFNQFKK